VSDREVKLSVQGLPIRCRFADECGYFDPKVRACCGDEKVASELCGVYLEKRQEAKYQHD
jgi:hypothetical protein